MKKITPNKLKVAKQELANDDLGDYEIPTTLNANEAEYYYILGINEIKNPAGRGVITKAKPVFYNQLEWQRQQKEIKSKKPLFTVVGGGQFMAVIILHDPTLPNLLDQDWQKTEIKELAASGKSSAEIAKALKLKIEDIEKSSKPKGLSPKQKGEVNGMLENGATKDSEGVSLIAKELGIEESRVQAYIDSLKDK
jgi:hypothetical protein